MQIRSYTPDDEVYQRILGRAQEGDAAVWQDVAGMVADVRQRGDEALLEYTRRFDKADLTAADLVVSEAELDAAEAQVDDAFLAAVSEARENIRRFHAYQKRASYQHDDGDGVILAKHVLPVARAGIYCPGGTAPLFSSMLMNAIPAQVAGVPEIVAVTPPRADGTVDPHLLACARLLQLDRVYRLGSAWAVAALAYGTQTVSPVDMIAGPGNIYVSTAKRIVFGQVGIDSIAGPSEIVIICDQTARPAFVAADLLSQVEHGSGYESGVVLTNHEPTARAVAAEVQAQLGRLTRADTVRKSLERYGAIFTVDALDQAIEAANAIAPEHLEIQTECPQSICERIVNAGAIFLGPWSSEPVGDYFAGTNHVLPTGGAARFASSLSVYDFLKDISIVQYSRTRLAQTGRHIIHMAELEGLTAHANAIRVRLEALDTTP